MKRLTLIRHAKSDWSSAAISDFDRPLNGRGKKAAPLMGQRLAADGCAPDHLLSSPAKRARQTAKKIAGEIGYPPEEIEYRPAIYDADLQTLVDQVRGLDDSLNQVILIGHNPGFSELGQWLTSAAPEWLPTCGLLDLELAIERWADASADCATLLRYDYPKKPE
jgi:phosphohistidine phosphatase